MRTTHRRSALALLTATALLVPAACGGGGDGGGGGGGDAAAGCPIGALEGADGPVEVTIWHGFTSISGKILDDQVKAFNESQDQVRVVAQNQGQFDELQSKVEQAAVDDELPGLAVLEDTKTQWAADSGLFAPAQACIDEDPEIGEMFDDLLPIVRASYEVDDTLYPASFSVFTALVFYNQAHFEDAGLDPAVPPATFDDIEEMAEAIKAAKPDVTPLAFLAAPWQFEWLMSGAGVPIVDNDNGRSGLATESLLENDTAIELLTRLRAMREEGLADIIPFSPGQADHLLAMAQQQSSMVIESSAGATTVAGVIEGTIDAQQLKDDLGIDLPPGSENLKLDLRIEAGPIPGVTEAGKGQVGGGVWYIPATNSPEVQAGAWEFIRFLNQPENQAVWAGRGSNTPAFASTADEPELQEAWESSLGGRWQRLAFEVLEDGVDPDFPGPVIGPYTEMRAAIRKALDEVLLDGRDPAEALAEADATMADELELYRQDVGG
jgi:sn-glycerol 3-phosphate transport system substrate-binding protein